MLWGFVINVLLFVFVVKCIYSACKANNLPVLLILFLCCLKTIFGCIYGIIYAKNIITSDTWNYHFIALAEFDWLQKNFLEFAIDLFKHGYTETQTDTFFSTEQSYWKDLPLNLLVKLLAIFNTLSKGNYYVNVLLYNILTVLGNIYMFKTVVLWFPDKRKLAFVLCCLFPPLLFWTSGIHKDGIVFTFIGIIVYFVSLAFTKPTVYRYFAIALLGFTGLFLFRNFVALSFLPWIVAFAIALKCKKNLKRIYFSTLIVGVFVFAFSSFGPPAINFPKKIQERQAQYLQLKGNSYIETPTLKIGVKSFVEMLPIAVNHTFCRPYIAEATSFLAIISAFESYFVISILLIVLLFFRKQIVALQHPFLLFLLFVAFTNYLLIGYTVPFTGAIVRYRVIFELFILIVLFCIIDANQLISRKLNNLYVSVTKLNRKKQL